MAYHVLGHNLPDKIGPELREELRLSPYGSFVHLRRCETEQEARKLLDVFRGGVVADYYEAFSLVVEVEG